MKITVIGAGNMGGALIKGWAKAFKAGATVNGSDAEITITAHTQQTLDRYSAEFPQLHCTLDNKAAARDADLIILAVKPWLLPSIVNEITSSLNLNNQIIVSVAANVTTPQLKEMLKDAPGADSATAVFYAMPNIAAEYGESMTFIAKGEDATAEQLETVSSLFSLVGKVKVCEERLIAAGMMMAGCGIAYVMRFIRAMMEGGVEMGFYPKDAQMIAMQTMQGAVSLLNETGLHPEAAIDKVTTPGGVTIKGLNELDHAGFNSAVIRCLKAGLSK